MLTAAALAVTEVIEVPVRYSAVGIAAVMIAAAAAMDVILVIMFVIVLSSLKVVVFRRCSLLYSGSFRLLRHHHFNIF